MVLLSTENDGSPDLAAISSAWALGWTVVLGIAANGHTADNLRARPDVVVNLPSPAQWAEVERLAPLTGRDPVPADKPMFRRERAKFEAAELTPQPSRLVRPPRPCNRTSPRTFTSPKRRSRPCTGPELGRSFRAETP